MKKIYVPFLCILVVFISAISFSEERDLNEVLDSMIGWTKFDDMLSKLGGPEDVVQGDEIFIATWTFKTSQSATIDPTSLLGLSPGEVSEVYRMTSRRTHKEVLTITFDKNTRLMKQWSIRKTTE